MNLMYPIGTNTDGTTKATWVFDALVQGWPGARKIQNYSWPGTTSVYWGFLGSSYSLIQEHRKQKIPFLFSDMPYFGRFMPNFGREKCYWRIIPNALHCNWIHDFPSDRVQKLSLDVQDWKTTGDYILVCPSSPMIERYYNENNWLARTLKALERVTDRPVRVRYKPRARGLSGPIVADIPFQDDCRNAHAVVTLCSLAAVEAVCLGVPSFCSSVSAAAPVSCTSLSRIENPLRPDRTAWLNTLSYFQYTESEISSELAYEFFQSLNWESAHPPTVSR